MYNIWEHYICFVVVILKAGKFAMDDKVNEFLSKSFAKIEILEQNNGHYDISKQQDYLAVLFEAMGAIKTVILAQIYDADSVVAFQGMLEDLEEKKSEYFTKVKVSTGFKERVRH